MKRILKAILPILVVTAILGGGALAYVALTSTGEITIDECLSFVGDNTFSVSLYPQDSEVVQLTVANASGNDIEIDLLSTIDPDPGAKGLTVDIPTKVTIPATGQGTIDITITAGKSVLPETYVVTIEVDR